ncbi:MAG: SPFH/Band 7/PHB domain protein [Candidatus Latescibacteria bacterium]|nr:SPFH/Band 7/PHB domain protein [Candidatus Latescibacterota bacterium]NIO55398.1 SPFH/Band 7/PHB domain protein [Candidatus Latescibacterota bacterium]
METTGIAVLVVIAIVIFITAATGIRIVRPWEKGLVERLGKYQRTASSGLTIIIPFMESMRKVDMREQVVDVPPQQVITQDNVAVEVDAVVYYEVSDPIKVTYNVENFYLAATKLAQTNLRNLIGDLALDESLTSREIINTKLREILDDATDKWGTKVTRVELQRIEPPQDVTDAMHRQMKAERDRRATILEAEGQKKAAILEAEGTKQAAILRAEGEAEAIRKVADARKYEEIIVAEGEGQAIETVYGSIHKGDPTNDLIAIKYLEALANIADGQATKVFLPLEASGVLGSIAGVAELLKEKFAGGGGDSQPDHIPSA